MVHNGVACTNWYQVGSNMKHEQPIVSMYMHYEVHLNVSLCVSL